MVGITDLIEYIDQGILDDEEAAYRWVQSDLKIENEVEVMIEKHVELYSCGWRRSGPTLVPLHSVHVSPTSALSFRALIAHTRRKHTVQVSRALLFELFT